MTVDDFQACSEVCRAHGFVRQAEFFQGYLEDRCIVYVVVEYHSGFDRSLREDPYLVGEDGSGEGGDPVLIFLDRKEAERAVDRRNLEIFRGTNLIELCNEESYGELELDLLSEMTVDELSEQIGAILGQPYRFPDEHPAPMPIFPTSATDDQMRRIIELFRLRFCYLREAELKV